MRWKKERLAEKGFTLIELILVMAILALLMALAVPRFTAALENSKIQAHNANVKMIEQAAELAYINGVKVGDIKMQKLVDDDYLKEAPEVPKIKDISNSTYDVTATINEKNKLIITVIPAAIDKSENNP
ncbi:MAG TPA: prepilin-type N-terminal cleavage/methylation domain-containing protein [Syntrophomonadaceae bacterium]|nr:prepilin-type N-terminal cleavage/methylation domain-containing protein [Syntrophomonadaceae bacterium]